METNICEYLITHTTTQDTHYWFKVSAAYYEGYNLIKSEKSAADEGWKSSSGSTITPPTTVTASNGTSSDYVLISWNSVTDAVSYNIYRANVGIGRLY